MLVDHSPREDVALIIGTKHIKQHYDGFAFEKKQDNMINANYHHNLIAKSTKFKEIIAEIVKDISSKKLLKKIVQ